MAINFRYNGFYYYKRDVFLFHILIHRIINSRIGVFERIDDIQSRVDQYWLVNHRSADMSARRLNQIYDLCYNRTDAQLVLESFVCIVYAKSSSFVSHYTAVWHFIATRNLFLFEMCFTISVELFFIWK